MNKSELLKELRIERDAPEEGSSSRLRLWLALGAGLLVLAGLLAWFFNRERPIEVAVATARAMPATSAGTSVLDATGYVTARRQATVSAKITGKVRDVRIEEGQRVKAGDILATLDDSETRVDVELRRAQVSAARAQLAEAEAGSANADREYKRQQDMAERKLTSVSALDSARAQSEGLRARVASQTSAVRVAQEALAAAQVQLDNTIVRAPFDGVVTVKAAQPGEMISPISAGGGSIRTGIGTIVDMDSLEIQVDVSEAYINRVQPGQKVEAVLNAYPGLAHSGLGDRHRPDRGPLQGDGEGTHRARREGRAHRAGDGRAGCVSRVEGSRRPARPPRRAARWFRPRPSGRMAGKDVVFLLRDGRAERRAVSLGGTLGDSRQVQAGVTAGDTADRGCAGGPQGRRRGEGTGVRR